MTFSDSTNSDSTNSDSSDNDHDEALKILLHQYDKKWNHGIREYLKILDIKYKDNNIKKISKLIEFMKLQIYDLHLRNKMHKKLLSEVAKELNNLREHHNNTEKD